MEKDEQTADMPPSLVSAIAVPTVGEVRCFTIERLLREFELCDVSGRLAIIEHAISQMRSTHCGVCSLKFVNDDYKVIPCLCRLHTMCLKQWLTKTKHSKPRQCPSCATVIEDDNDLWRIAELRDASWLYHYGVDTNDDIVAAKRNKMPTPAEAAAVIDSDDPSASDDEDGPEHFYPRARVPPQSPRRKTKGKIKKMLRRAGTDENLLLAKGKKK